MKVLIGESICPVVSSVTGLNIRCAGENCVGYDKEEKLCCVHEPIKKKIPTIIAKPCGIQSLLREPEVMWSCLEFIEHGGIFGKVRRGTYLPDGRKVYYE